MFPALGRSRKHRKPIRRYLIKLSFHHANQKELAMHTNNPNRIKRQIANFDEILQKKSGDQHIEPQDEQGEAPHRPHRVNREDMQKIVLPNRDSDESS
jgi:hypothetical protein